jgi:alpha/beta hydrolase fold
MHLSATTHPPVVLEPESQAFVEATAKPPFLYELTPADARKVLDDVQAAPIDKLPAKDRWITVPADVGDVRVRIVRPPDAEGMLPLILYMHGGGWVLGNAETHDRLVRELADGTEAAVVFVEYDRSPEAHYPVAIEQGYATAKWIVREGDANQLDPDRIAVAGDSVGGCMTAALALMANERGDVRFVQQSMQREEGEQHADAERDSDSAHARLGAGGGGACRRDEAGIAPARRETQGTPRARVAFSRARGSSLQRPMNERQQWIPRPTFDAVGGRAKPRPAER